MGHAIVGTGGRGPRSTVALPRRLYETATSTATLEAASYFEEHKYGIIIMRIAYDPSSSGIPWDVTEDNLRKILRRLKDTGALVVFWDA